MSSVRLVKGRPSVCYCYYLMLYANVIALLATLASWNAAIWCCNGLSFSSFFTNNNNKFPFSTFAPNTAAAKYGITRTSISGRYPNMTISSLGCGTWSWGNRLLYNYNDDQDVELYQAYKVVRDGGVTIFDTADSYGTLNYNGRAEILLGQFERQYQSDGTSTTVKNRKKLQQQQQQIATKLAPYPWRITRQNIVAAARGSIRRIENQPLAMVQAHWSTANYQPYQERAIWDGLADVYESGLCDSIGVSNYGPQQLAKIYNYYQTVRNVPLATAQIQYSLLTYADPITRDMDDVCKETGVKLISYSPLCLGLLTGKYTIDNVNSIPSLPRRQLFRELLPSAQRLLQLMNAIAIDKQKTMSQVAINWCVQKNTIPIPGCRTIQQAIETIDSVQFKLTKSDIDELDRLAKSISKPMIQNVFQTK